MDSILQHTKAALGISEDDSSFDVEITMHINNAFSTLNDLGVGPETGFVIEDDTEVWTDLFPNEDDPVKLKIILSKVKTYIYLKVKQVFDPPTSPAHVTAMENQIRETEWRLNVNREETEWVDPTVTDSDLVVVDGGNPAGE